MDRMSLDGQTAIVTGAAQGIGRAIAERLLDDGATVSLWDLDGPLLDRTSEALMPKGKVSSAVVDVTDPASVGQALAETLSGFGPPDILINNAGIAGLNATTWDYPIEEWHRVLAIDLNGVFYCCRAVVPTMIERGYGRIVNVASIAGKEGNPNASAYSAAKAGVIALTKSLGKELAQHDIAVNCITPAAARTRIFDQMSEEHIAYMLSKIPRGRFVEVEEVAALVAWLASRDCSFTTGAVFDISGGRATY
jgi:3-oxoacyl-[acyl-carrier protein] reductase